MFRVSMLLLCWWRSSRSGCSCGSSSLGLPGLCVVGSFFLVCGVLVEFLLGLLCFTFLLFFY